MYFLTSFVLISTSFMVGPGLVSVLWLAASSSGGRSRWCSRVPHALPVIGVATLDALAERGHATVRAVVHQAIGPKREASDVSVTWADNISGCGDSCLESHGVQPVLIVMVVFNHSYCMTLPYLTASHKLNKLVVSWPQIWWWSISQHE